MVPRRSGLSASAGLSCSRISRFLTTVPCVLLMGCQMYHFHIDLHCPQDVLCSVFTMCGLHAKSVITSRLVSVLIITLHYIILDFLMNMIKLLPFTCRKVFSF